MKRKGWVRFLSCAIALLLPVSAFAQSAAIDLLEQAKTDGKEIVSTITFEPGATLASDKIVKNMSAATAIRLNKLPGGYGAIAVVLSGVDVISGQLRVEKDGIYVQSETLGEKPLYFSWDDMNKGIMEAMKSSGADQNSIDQFNSSFMNGIQQAMATMAAQDVTEDKALTPEEIKQKIAEAMGGDEAIVQWLNAIEAKKVVTTGEFTLEGSDVANTKTELTITKDDINALYDVPYIQKQIAIQLKSKDSTLTDEQLTAKTAETVAQAKADIEKSNVNIPMTFYCNGETELIAMEMTMTGNFTRTTVNPAATDAAPADAAATESVATAAPATVITETVKAEMRTVFTRKTTDADKQYTLTVKTKSDDKEKFGLLATLKTNDKNATGSLTVTDDKAAPLMQVNLAADYSDAKHVTGELDAAFLGQDNTGAAVLGFDQTIGDATIDTALSVSYGTTVEAIKAAKETALLGTLKVNMTVQEDSGFFSNLKEATPATSLELMKLNETDMQTYTGSLQSNLMQTLYKVFGNLPPDVASELSGLMGNQ